MARKKSAKPVAQAPSSGEKPLAVPDKVRPSPLLDTRVIYCGDNLVQLRKLRVGCVELARVLKRTGHSINHLASNR